MARCPNCGDYGATLGDGWYDCPSCGGGKGPRDTEEEEDLEEEYEEERERDVDAEE